MNTTERNAAKRMSLILVSGTIMLATAAGLAAAEPPQRTIFGTNGNDLLRGTSAAEFIFGLAGNDAIQAAGGDDIVFGGPGSDAIFGGSGDDTIIGGADEPDGHPDGNDLLSGGSGNDQLIDEAGNNQFSAGSGDDFVRSRNGKRDFVSCGGGFDRVVPDPARGLDIISDDCEVQFQGQG